MVVLILERLPVTLELTLLAVGFALVLGIPAGILSATRRDQAIDNVTRVGTLLYARDLTSRNYPDSGTLTSFHGGSHHQDDPAQIRRYADLNRYHVSTLGYLAESFFHSDSARSLLWKAPSCTKWPRSEALASLPLAPAAGRPVTGLAAIAAGAGVGEATVTVAVEPPAVPDCAKFSIRMWASCAHFPFACRATYCP